jgi:YfiH family protein
LKTRANSAIEFAQWPAHSQLENAYLDDKVLAMQTSRLSPDNISVELGENNTAYKNCNLGLHVGDCAKRVERNRRCLQELLPSKTSIQWLEQVHGNSVVEISSVTKQTIIADAMVTRVKNIALAIMTADCLPILLISNQGNEIAAIHGGWRPLAANIITNTVNKMHTTADEIYAWLGPCIGKKAFEVGSEVQMAFVEQGSIFSQAFSKQENGKYLADLHEIATLQLHKLGITQISRLSECTYSEPEKYYSYRKESTTGRMATVITLL